MAAPQLLQSKTLGTGAAPTVAITWSKNTSAGSLILVVVGTNNTGSTVSSITDSQNNVYTKVDSGTATSDNGELWYSSNIAAGATPTITLTVSSIFNVAVIIQEWAGSTTTPLDVHTTGSGSSTAVVSAASAQPTQGKNLVVGWMVGGSSGGTITVGTGYSNLQTQTSVAQIALETKIMNGITSQTATFTLNSTNTFVCGIALFQYAGSSFAQPSNNLRPAIFKPGLAR